MQDLILGKIESKGRGWQEDEMVRYHPDSMSMNLSKLRR